MRPAYDKEVNGEWVKKFKFYECDFFKQDYPKVDAIMYGNVIHDWPDETKHILLKKAVDSLEEGGYLVVYDFFIDNARKSTTHSYLMSLHMQLAIGGS